MAIYRVIMKACVVVGIEARTEDDAVTKARVRFGAACEDYEIETDGVALQSVCEE